MEVKMFVCNDPKDAEQKINQWLTHAKVNIQYITQSQSEKNGNFVFVVSVFYKSATVPNGYISAQ